MPEREHSRTWVGVLLSHALFHPGVALAKDGFAVLGHSWTLLRAALSRKAVRRDRGTFFPLGTGDCQVSAGFPSRCSAGRLLELYSQSHISGSSDPGSSLLTWRSWAPTAWWVLNQPNHSTVFKNTAASSWLAIYLNFYFSLTAFQFRCDLHLPHTSLVSGWKWVGEKRFLSS